MFQKNMPCETLAYLRVGADLATLCYVHHFVSSLRIPNVFRVYSFRIFCVGTDLAMLCYVHYFADSLCIPNVFSRILAYRVRMFE